MPTRPSFAFDDPDWHLTRARLARASADYLAACRRHHRKGPPPDIVEPGDLRPVIRAEYQSGAGSPAAMCAEG